MLCCAAESGKRPANDGITFGEFCLFASELKLSHNNNVKSPMPLSKLSDEYFASAKRPKRTISIFLGGSCNPTTWRKDVAIPSLKLKNITYYNPQVSHWGPELIELENQAKQNADVLFFVIDNQTRSVASMIEAAHLAGSHRKLILIINTFEGPGDKVLDEPISKREYEDLRIGQAHLQDLVERQNIPVFRCIETALQCTAKVVKEGISVQELSVNDGARPIKMSHLRLGEKIVKLREIFSSLDVNENGHISFQDVCMALRILNFKDLNFENMNKINENFENMSNILKLDGNNGFNYNKNNINVNFDQFCCIVAEFKHEVKAQNLNEEVNANRLSNVIHSILDPVSKLFSWAIPRRVPLNLVSNSINNNNGIASKGLSARDIFLGGSHGDSLWRENIAIPILKKHGITYFNPKVSSWKERLIPIQLAAVESSRVLLFVITRETRSLSSMALAAHYAGLGCNMVLCIQYLREDIVIGNEKLSKQGVKDYNRGRVYLSDLANRDGIPIFDNIEEAVDCVIQKLRMSS
ncbi:hypothetical protein GQR58_012004 [Nymphon striatum]|nr:hypothetical protein GQR58_012004 [Nymphon striatum]